MVTRKRSREMVHTSRSFVLVGVSRAWMHYLTQAHCSLFRWVCSRWFCFRPFVSSYNTCDHVADLLTVHRHCRFLRDFRHCMFLRDKLTALRENHGFSHVGTPEHSRILYKCKELILSSSIQSFNKLHFSCKPQSVASKTSAKLLHATVYNYTNS